MGWLLVLVLGFWWGWRYNSRNRNTTTAIPIRIPTAIRIRCRLRLWICWRRNDLAAIGWCRSWSWSCGCCRGTTHIQTTEDVYSLNNIGRTTLIRPICSRTGPAHWVVSIHRRIFIRTDSRHQQLLLPLALWVRCLTKLRYYVVIFHGLGDCVLV